MPPKFKFKYPLECLGFGYKGLVFCKNYVPKFFAQSQKFGTSMKKKLHLASVVHGQGVLSRRQMICTKLAQNQQGVFQKVRCIPENPSKTKIDFKHIVQLIEHPILRISNIFRSSDGNLTKFILVWVFQRIAVLQKA